MFDKPRTPLPDDSIHIYSASSIRNRLMQSVYTFQDWTTKGPRKYLKLSPQRYKVLDLRLKIKKFWIHRLRCPAPRGLNICY